MVFALVGFIVGSHVNNVDAVLSLDIEGDVAQVIDEVSEMLAIGTSILQRTKSHRHEKDRRTHLSPLIAS